MKPKLKKPKPLMFGTQRLAYIGDQHKIVMDTYFWCECSATALRKWLGDAVKYLKQEAKKK